VAAGTAGDLRGAAASRSDATKLLMPVLSSDEDGRRVANLPIKVTQQQQQQQQQVIV